MNYPQDPLLLRLHIEILAQALDALGKDSDNLLRLYKEYVKAAHAEDQPIMEPQQFFEKLFKGD